MEFEGQYLTFEEYEELGGTLTKTPFNLLEFEARKQVDLRTQNRLKACETIPEEVKLCVYHLIDFIILCQNENSNNIASETVGSYSVSYNNQVKDVIKNKKSEMGDIIINDLYGVAVNGEHVIYNGVL